MSYANKVLKRIYSPEFLMLEKIDDRDNLKIETPKSSIVFSNNDEEALKRLLNSKLISRKKSKTLRRPEYVYFLTKTGRDFIR